MTQEPTITAARRTFWDAPTWRTGRKVGRTIYAQMGPEPSDDDPLIGVMDTPDLAALVVLAVNAHRENPYGD
jgi:hypothetical protein